MPSSFARPSRPRTRRAALLAAATLAAASFATLVPAGEASAQGWLDGPAFAFPSNAFPAFAEAPDGTSTGVWSDGTDIFLQHAAPDGTTARVQRLLPVGSGSPIFAAGPSSAGAVVWDSPANQDGTPVDVTFVSPDGTPGRTVQAGSTTNFGTAVAALDAAGDATVAWTGSDGVAAAHVAPDGTVTAIPLHGASTASGSTPQVAVAPDGTAWIGWLDETTASNGIEWIERVAPDGTAGPYAAVNDPGADPADLQLAANAAGGVAVWRTESGNARVLRGARLPATGDDVTDGADLAIGTTPVEDEQMPAAPAIGPDGTISVLWTDDDGDGSAQGTTSVILSRFAPGSTTATEHTFATAAAGRLEGFQQLAAAPDGTLLAEWLDMSDTGSAAGATVLASRIAADGTIGPTATAATVAFPAGLSLIAGALVHPFVDEVGGALIVALSFDEDTDLVTSTRRLDAAGPVTTADVPGTAVAGAPVGMSATASDPTGATVAWDFGDGSATASGLSVQHAFAAPGTYTVTVTATDGEQNETVVRKQVTVTAADTGAGPGGPAGPDTSAHGSGGGPAPAGPAKPAPAKLTIAKATRTGAKVTVTGTIAKAASRRVTVTYKVKSGRRTVTKKVMAAIVKGRWSASFKLTGKLASVAALRAKATVTVAFSGSAHVKKASANHAVRTAKKPAHRALRKKR